jgi:hypothetical protein
MGLETLIWKTYMSRVLNELLRLLQSMMWIDSSMSLHTTPIPNRLPTSSAQRYGVLRSAALEMLTLSGKGRGEQVVRSIFPETTIVRPAPLFGFEDRLLHKLAGMTNVFTSNHMQERYNPVHVSDWQIPDLINAHYCRLLMWARRWRSCSMTTTLHPKLMNCMVQPTTQQQRSPSW